MKAVKHAIALGLTITCIKKGAVYDEFPAGTLFFKKAIEKKAAPFKLAKGMILQAI